MKEFRAAFSYAKEMSNPIKREYLEYKIDLFKAFFRRNYGYMSLELTNEQIAYYIAEQPTIAKACDIAADYLLANGLSEVQP